MSNRPVGQGPKASPPTPPATPSAAGSKRGWETTPVRRAAPTTPPATPPTSPPALSAGPHSTKRYASATNTSALVSLKQPNTALATGAPITTDGAGHRPLDRSALKRLSPSERNMHDHWYGRTDRGFHSHAKEFEMLAQPITSWQGYMGLAKSVVAQKNSPSTTCITLGEGKTGIYDSARNLFVVCAPRDQHIITMYRPGINLLPENQRPKFLAPLAQGQKYVARLT